MQHVTYTNEIFCSSAGNMNIPKMNNFPTNLPQMFVFSKNSERINDLTIRNLNL